MGTDLFEQGSEHDGDTSDSPVPVVKDPTGSLSLSRTVTPEATGPKVNPIPEPDPDLIALFAPLADGDFDPDGKGGRRRGRKSSGTTDDWQQLLDDSIPVQSLAKTPKRAAPALTAEFTAIDGPAEPTMSDRRPADAKANKQRGTKRRGLLASSKAAVSKLTSPTPSSRPSTSPESTANLAAVADAGAAAGATRTADAFAAVTPTTEDITVTATAGTTPAEAAPGDTAATDDNTVDQVAAEETTPADDAARSAASTSATADAVAETTSESAPTGAPEPDAPRPEPDVARALEQTLGKRVTETTGYEKTANDLLTGKNAIGGTPPMPSVAHKTTAWGETSRPATSRLSGDTAAAGRPGILGQPSDGARSTARSTSAPEGAGAIGTLDRSTTIDEPGDLVTSRRAGTILPAADGEPAKPAIATEVLPLRGTRPTGRGIASKHRIAAMVAVLACVAVVGALLVSGERDDGGADTAADTEEAVAQNERSDDRAEPAPSSTTSPSSGTGAAADGSSLGAGDLIAAAGLADPSTSTTDRASADDDERDPSTTSADGGTAGSGGDGSTDSAEAGDTSSTIDPSSTTSEASSTTEMPTTTDTSTTTCSGVTWNAVLDEGFDGSSVDTAVWAIGEGSAGQGVQQPNAVSVSGGALNITAQMLEGTLVTGGLQHRSSQMYGRWEVRVRTDADASGVMNGRVFTAGSGSSHIIYDTGATGTAWHTMAVEWTPTSVKYFTDGALVRTVDETDGGDVVPDVAHTLSIRYNAGAGTLPTNVTMQVDYVKVWEYGGGC